MDDIRKAYVLINKERKRINLGDYKNRKDFFCACGSDFVIVEHHNIPSNWIKNNWISTKVWEYCDELKNLEDSEVEPFIVWLSECCQDFSITASEAIDEFGDSYQGIYENEEDFAAYYLANEYVLPSSLEEYFDLERYSEHLFSSGFYFYNRYVFKI